MLKVSNIAVSLDEKDYAKVIANTLNIRKSQVKNVKIARKAVDARRKNKVHFNMGFTFECANEDQLLKTHSKQVSKVKEYHYDKLTPNNQTIMVVGSGPAGLFCAYNLARSGQKVILIEQGKCVDERKKDIDTYLETGKLNVQSNVQFGEGGAGTFSDGKLTTGIKDYRKQFVLNTFYEHGANEDILYLNKPHLGTDVLINVVKNIRKDIEKCGEVRFETKLVDLIVENNQIKEVVLENKEGTYKEKVDQLVLAIGHSARNTYEMLYQKQLEISQKAFAVGMRIEHSQEFINKSQYGKFYNHPALKAADYKLAVHTSQKRGVYTFCMCPGGYVMNAASEENRLVVNGMSNYKRDNKFANSAILVNVTPDDFGSSHPLAGMYFQRKLEEKAFELGGSDYSIPVQRVEDYLENKEELDQLADKVVYTGPIDAYFNYQLGTLEYRSVRFETELLDIPNFQGNAAVNYTDRETPWTRIIEHKWFEFGKDKDGNDIDKTVISREYSSEWKPGDEPYYPVNDERNNKLYAKYKELADQNGKVIFGGRLGMYKYFDMDAVIAEALNCVKENLGEQYDRDK